MEWNCTSCCVRRRRGRIERSVSLLLALFGPDPDGNVDTNALEIDDFAACKEGRRASCIPRRNNASESNASESVQGKSKTIGNQGKQYSLHSQTWWKKMKIVQKKKMKNESKKNRQKKITMFPWIDGRFRWTVLLFQRQHERLVQWLIAAQSTGDFLFGLLHSFSKREQSMETCFCLDHWRERWARRLDRDWSQQKYPMKLLLGWKHSPRELGQRLRDRNRLHNWKIEKWKMINEKWKMKSKKKVSKKK